MFSLANYSDEQIVSFIKEGWVTVDDLVDSNVCPICFNQEHDNVLFGDRLLYENDELECFLIDKPRSDGHVIITTKKHYNDILAIDSDLYQNIFLFTRKVMAILNDVYSPESIYLCYMNNNLHDHFQIELIPKYDYEKSGACNFIKPRKDYISDEVKVKKIRSMINE